MKEEYLKSPSPNYLFDLIKNTMNITGFLKGLFTPEEETTKYFKAKKENKIKFFTKVIDITKIITKVNFTIEISNLLNSSNVDQTYIFLENFYKASIINIDTKRIINKYLKDIKKKEAQTVNDKNNPIENQLQKINIKKLKLKLVNQANLEEEKKGYILWIDENVNKSENISNLNFFKENPYNQLLLSFQLLCFDNLEEVYDLIFNYINFKIIFIIISGELYPDYYYKLKNNIKFIKCLPICVIFTSDELKEIFIKRKSQLYLTEEVFDSIHNSFYNLGGVTSNFKYRKSRNRTPQV